MLKKKILLGIGACALTLGVSSFASAAGSWSSTVTLDVPGLNKSAFPSWNSYKKSKVSNDARASFQAISRTSYSGMDARVINSNNASRSSWARNMKPGTRINVSTTAAKGYYYNTEISSDITQIGTDTISYKWSPDQP